MFTRFALSAALVALAITDAPVPVRHLVHQVRYASAIEESQRALRDMVAAGRTPGSQPPSPSFPTTAVASSRIGRASTRIGIGISSWLFIYPERDMVIALLANVNTAPVGGQAQRRIAAAFASVR